MICTLTDTQREAFAELLVSSWQEQGWKWATDNIVPVDHWYMVYDGMKYISGGRVPYLAQRYVSKCAIPIVLIRPIEGGSR